VHRLGGAKTSPPTSLLSDGFCLLSLSFERRHLLRALLLIQRELILTGSSSSDCRGVSQSDVSITHLLWSSRNGARGIPPLPPSTLLSAHLDRVHKQERSFDHRLQHVKICQAVAGSRMTLDCLMPCQRGKSEAMKEIEQAHKTCAYDECSGSEGSDGPRCGSDRLAFAASLASLRVPIRVLPISSTYSIRARSSSSTCKCQRNSHSIWRGSRGHTE
jgi:hypothetical protein